MRHASAPRLAVLGVVVAAVAGAIASATPRQASAQANVTPQQAYSERGADSCLLCHRDATTRAVFANRHGNPRQPGTPFAAGGLQCEACHGPAGAHARLQQDGTRPPPTGFGANGDLHALDDNCLGCHAADVAPHWDASDHRLADVACASCHRSHGDDHDGGQQTRIADSNAVCVACHQRVDDEFRKPFTHAVADGKIGCIDCHAPHGSNSEVAFTAASATATCLACHAAQRGPFLWEHEPVVEDCQNCHAAHGATQPALLQRRAPFLCQSCHSAAGHPSLAQRDGQPRESALLYGASCLSCHSQVHGSNHPSGQLLMR